MKQIHSKFKLFVAPGKETTSLFPQVEAFARDHKIAPKSIGVEYLEHSQSLIMTLGYADDQEPHAITLHSCSVGKLDGDHAGLEARMGEAAAKFGNVICHELYVTEQNDVIMVFMCKA